MIEQGSLHPAPAVGIPVRCHHIGEIVRRHSNAPGIPIEEPDVIGSAIARQEVVPDMSVAVNERKMATRVIAREETGSRVKKLLVQIAPFTWQAVAETVGKILELDFKSLQ